MEIEGSNSIELLTDLVMSLDMIALYIFGYSKFEVESSAFLNEKKNLISNFEVENCYNPILRNFALWLKTANVIASWNLLNTCIDTE